MKIEGFDYSELCDRWELKYDEYSAKKKEKACFILKKYIENNKLSKFEIKDIRKFLKKLSKNSFKLNYDSQIYLEISRVKDNGTMLNWFKDNIEKFWV